MAGAQSSPDVSGATMAGDGYLAVRRPPKPGVTSKLTPLERDAVERLISCPCPCTLDVFTCRTSMPCGFSPRMHTDVLALADGGYSADEILAAFRETYGARVLMAPPAEGFNWVGWLAPFAAIGTGAVAVAALIRRWGRRAEARRAGAAPLPIDATEEELARLEAAVREEDR